MPTEKHSTAWQLTVYLSKTARKARLIQRLKVLAHHQRRSLNFIVVEALLQYVEREEYRS